MPPPGCGNATAAAISRGENLAATGADGASWAAIPVLALIPAPIAFSLVQRHIVVGLTFGAGTG